MGGNSSSSDKLIGELNSMAKAFPACNQAQWGGGRVGLSVKILLFPKNRFLIRSCF
jgi:hypothetical protein